MAKAELVGFGRKVPLTTFAGSEASWYIDWMHPLTVGLETAWKVCEGIQVKRNADSTEVVVKGGKGNDFYLRWGRVLSLEEIQSLRQDPYAMFAWPPTVERLPWYRRVLHWLRMVLGSFKWS